MTPMMGRAGSTLHHYFPDGYSLFLSLTHANTLTCLSHGEMLPKVNKGGLLAPPLLLSSTHCPALSARQAWDEAGPVFEHLPMERTFRIPAGAKGHGRGHGRGHGHLARRGSEEAQTGWKVIRSHRPTRGNSNFYEHLNDNTSS